MTLLWRREGIVDTIEVVVPVAGEVAYLTGVLDIHHQPAEREVLVVDGEGAVLLPFVPVSHDDERHADVDAVVGHSLAHNLVSLRIVLLRVLHTGFRPVVGTVHQRFDGQFAVGFVEPFCPRVERHLFLRHRWVLLAGVIFLVFHHLEVCRGHGNAGQSCGQTCANVLLVHFVAKG